MDDMPLLRALVEHNATAGFAEGRRLVWQGAVTVNGEVVTDQNTTVTTGDTVKVGRRKLFKIL